VPPQPLLLFQTFSFGKRPTISTLKRNHSLCCTLGASPLRSSFI